MKKIILGLLCWPLYLSAQLPDHIYRPNIRTVKLFKYGDIYSYPVIQLGTNEQLELHFDDMDNDVKSYYTVFSCAMRIGHLRMSSRLTIYADFKVTALVPTEALPLCKAGIHITRQYCLSAMVDLPVEETTC